MYSEKIFTSPLLKGRRRELRRNMTKAEVMLWLELKEKKLCGHKFRRQHSIGIYLVDFYCPKLKLVIEIDDLTHSSKDEIEYDSERQIMIENLGISFLRFKNDEIYQNILNVIDRIKVKIVELESMQNAEL